MKHLKYILALSLLSLFVLACQKQETGACDCDGQPSGKKCKEIHYQGDVYIGYIEFLYNEDGSLQQKTLFSDQSENKKSQYSYDAQGRLIKEEISFGSGGIDQYWEYAYNEMDSLGRKSFFENGRMISQTLYSYNPQGRLSLKEEYRDSVLLGSESFSYDQTGKLWRFERFDGEGALREQRFFEYFSNGTERISLYDQNREYTGYIFIHRNEENLIRERKQYDSEELLTGYMLNVISGGRISRSTWYDASGRQESRTLFLYY